MIDDAPFSWERISPTYTIPHRQMNAVMFYKNEYHIPLDSESNVWMDG